MTQYTKTRSLLALYLCLPLQFKNVFPQYSFYNQLLGKGNWLCSCVFYFFRSVSYAKGVL